MNRPLESDEALAQEIAQIKAMHPYKGDYREQIAALLGVLFLKFGERVGASRVVALLAENGKSPSTSTAQDEINKFWHRVRANAVVKIDRPDLPPFLQEFFGEMAATVWTKSTAAAAALFEAQKQEMSDRLSQANDQVQQSNAEAAVAQGEKAQAKNELFRAQASATSLQADVANWKIQNERGLSQRAALEERLSAETQFRRDETERLAHTLEGVRSALDRAMSEQNRLLAIGDDYKQQASRDRASREKTEQTLVIRDADCERLRLALAQALQENAGLVVKLDVQDKQLMQARSNAAREASPGEARRGRLRRGTTKPRIR